MNDDRMEPLPRSGVGVDPPWLVMAPAGQPPIRIDLRLIDRIELFTGPESNAGSASDLFLVVGDLEVALHIADGPEAAQAVARHAAPLTRELAGGDVGAAPENFVFVGDDAVRCNGDRLTVGALVLRIGEVREHALRGANVPVGRGIVPGRHCVACARGRRARRGKP